MKRDLSTNLRTAQDTCDEADRRVTAARQAEQSASRAYDARRRRTPTGRTPGRPQAPGDRPMIATTSPPGWRNGRRDRLKSGLTCGFDSRPGHHHTPARRPT